MARPEPRRIAFLNEKGGSGKTTTAANVAAHLALRRGHRVLAIDLDPQAQLAKVLGVESGPRQSGAIDLVLDSVLDDGGLDRPSGARGELPALQTRIPGLDLVPGSKALGLSATLEGDDDVTGRLADALSRIPAVERYDFVLVDAPPSFGPLTLNALRAVDEVVVPVPLTWLALDGCVELLRTIESVRRSYDHVNLRISMVVATFYRRTRMAHELLDMLKARFPKQLAQTVIGTHVKLDEAQARGLSITEYAPEHRAGRAYAAIAEELDARRPERSEATT